MRKIIYELFGVCLIFLWIYPSFAAWHEHLPILVNSGVNPGTVNPHANSGGRRIVRNGRTIIVLCADQGGEKIYRSLDDGASWSEINSSSGFSGTLISGPGSMVYHFYVTDNQIWMVRFGFQESPSAPISIYQDSAVSETATGVYRAVNATVDATGNLYFAAHWGNPDQIYLLVSKDRGDSWQGPYQISSGDGPWYYPHLEVTPGNRLVAVYDSFAERHSIYFAASTDEGISWNRWLISSEATFNPAILTVSDDQIFVFAQSGEAAHTGLVMNYTNDAGQTWQGWRLIDPTCGYADPSPGLGSDGQSIYVAYRSSNGTGVTAGSCGDQSRSRMAMSPDFGRTWRFVDDFYSAERTGTRSQIRYQTWWNYGGPLEWIWMQYEDDGMQRYTCYDVNKDVEIYRQDSANPTTPQDPPGSGGQVPGSSATGDSPSSESSTGSGCYIATIGWP